MVPVPYRSTAVLDADDKRGTFEFMIRTSYGIKNMVFLAGSLTHQRIRLDPSGIRFSLE